MPPKPGQKANVTKSAQKGPGRKAAPKQPVPVPERLKRLFTSLCAQIDGGHSTNAIKTCDKILRLQPNDEDASKTKLFLLLQTEQYEDALALLNEDGDGSSHRFERAYLLYRLHREPEARGILQEIRTQELDHRGALHLEAQLNYREGSYQTAFDTYNELLDSAEPNSEEQSDIYTNLQASQQHLDFVNEGYLRALDQVPTKISAGLEAAPPPAPAAPAAPVSSAKVAESQQPINPPLKKVRMSRVPAGVTPGVTPPPDPERWLKKSERSTFGQGKRRKGAGGGATQGFASMDAPAPVVSTVATKAGGKSKKKR
ncbi:hypothetical protein FA15DRAFT_175941 [Coprinopsis marcescibilis]|uniref:Signal recognition particle subunit SRP72 n=1 Tax=Coprinopsis marcescibilis TaxID=230819 RepID=A0A5C3KI17_COPMA|nr:hypothetical protein FA15DRAFT_175941 [Coprinopsis marcescibilis]